MKYAPILFYLDEDRRWTAIGVIAVNRFGVARVKIHEHNPVVLKHSTLSSLEDRVNPMFDTGIVECYSDEIDATGCSIITRLYLYDPEFLEKYANELNKQGKYTRVGEVREYPGENIEEVIENLLGLVRGRIDHG